MHSAAGPEISIEMFTFGKWQRRAQAETEVRSVELIEEMVQLNTLDRFEEQKK